MKIKSRDCMMLNERQESENHSNQLVKKKDWATLSISFMDIIQNQCPRNHRPNQRKRKVAEEPHLRRKDLNIERIQCPAGSRMAEDYDSTSSKKKTVTIEVLMEGPNGELYFQAVEADP